MRRTLLRALGALLLLASLLVPLVASAHQTVTDSDYNIENGWVNEPVIINQPNAVVVNITPKLTGADSGQISLMSPADGASVQGDHTDVMVQFSGLPDNASAQGIHWHLMLDDQMLAMEPLDQTMVTITGLANGSHTVAATLADACHNTIGDMAAANINVSSASDQGRPPLAAPWVTNMGFTFTEPPRGRWPDATNDEGHS